jgi:hypothetical protein
MRVITYDIHVDYNNEYLCIWEDNVQVCEDVCKDIDMGFRSWVPLSYQWGHEHADGNAWIKGLSEYAWEHRLHALELEELPDNMARAIPWSSSWSHNLSWGCGLTRVEDFGIASLGCLDHSITSTFYRDLVYLLGLLVKLSRLTTTQSVAMTIPYGIL